MKKTLLILPFVLSLSVADTPKEKKFHAQDSNYQTQYANSSHLKNSEEQVISSSAQVSAEITVAVTVKASTEVTSQSHRERATVSFLDNNRVQITEEIAKGEGEYLETLLNMMALKKNNESLKKLQKNFNNLIYLSHKDFLKKVKSLV